MMHYGAILAKGEVGYTNLDLVFAALGNIQENYNWLITDCECNVDIPKLQYNYCWMSGSELTALERKYHNPQWIWSRYRTRWHGLRSCPLTAAIRC